MKRLNDRAGRPPREAVRFEKSEGWWVASLPGTPGAHSQGRTKGSAFRNLRDAVAGIARAHRDGLIAGDRAAIERAHEFLKAHPRAKKDRQSVPNRQTGKPVSYARLTSFHEAAHLVVALAKGLPVAEAALEVDGADGHTDHTKGLDWLTGWVAVYAAAQDVPRALVKLRPPRLSERQRKQVRGYIATAVAGHVAEGFVLEGAASQRWSAKDYVDRLHAEGAARMLGVDPRRAIETAREEARDILLDQAHRVAAVARELRRKVKCPAWVWREIKGAEVRKLFRAADAADDRRDVAIAERGLRNK